MGNNLTIYNMKYLVYLTTNTVNNKIYVGVHQQENPDYFDGYLGNGLNINDSYLINHPKEPFHYAVKKHGIKNFVRKTIKVFDTLDEALAMEKEIVNEEFIRRKDTYNITLGGGIPPSYKKTIYQYSLEGVFIKEWNSIREAAIFYKCSDSSIGRAILDRTPSMKYLWSEEKYEVLDLDLFKLDENKVITYLYDINGNFLQKFKSISECAKHLNTTPSKIQHAISGKYCIYKKWYTSDKLFDKFPIPEKINYKNKKLYQYDLQGEFIKEWENYSEVKKFFGKELGIHAAIR